MGADGLIECASRGRIHINGDNNKGRGKAQGLEGGGRGHVDERAEVRRVQVELWPKRKWWPRWGAEAGGGGGRGAAQKGYCCEQGQRHQSDRLIYRKRPCSLALRGLTSLNREEEEEREQGVCCVDGGGRGGREAAATGINRE